VGQFFGKSRFSRQPGLSTLWPRTFIGVFPPALICAKYESRRVPARVAVRKQRRREAANEPERFSTRCIELGSDRARRRCRFGCRGVVGPLRDGSNAVSMNMPAVFKPTPYGTAGSHQERARMQEAKLRGDKWPSAGSDRARSGSPERARSSSPGSVRTVANRCKGFNAMRVIHKTCA
jgi:hypothetical protein